MTPARRLFERLGPRHRRVAHAMMRVGVFVLLAKGIGTVREIAVAWRYGLGETVDVYLYALVLVGWLPALAVSALSAVLVPLVKSLPVVERARFVDELSTAVVLGAAATIAVLAVAVPAAVPVLASGFSDAARAQMRWVLVALAPAGAFMLVSAFLSAMLLAAERHANTLLEATPAVVVLAAVLLWPVGAGYAPLVVGMLAGTALQCAALAALLRRSGTAPRPARRLSHPAWHGFARALSTLSVGTFVIGFASLIDQFLAARAGEGAVSALGYATRLLALPLGLGATAVARAILPVLSDADLDPERRARMARQWSLALFAGGSIAAGAVYLLAPAIVELLFERGQFTGQDTERVARVVRFGAPQLPFYFGGIVLVQLCASLGRYRRIAVSSFVALGVKLATGFVLVERFGVAGVTLSTALMYVATYAYFHVSISASPPRRDADRR